MQFLITAYDGTDADALERRMRVRPAHLENIARVKEKGRVVCAGGITNAENSPKGSFLIMEFASRTELEEYLESEPYIREQVWKDVKVEYCSVVIENNEMH